MSMRKGKAVIGKDVLSFLDGRRIHSVKDLIIGGDNNSIVAILVDDGGLFGTAKVVPMTQVVNFGKDAVVVSDSQAAIPADSYQPVREVLDRKEKMLGKKVFTEGGTQEGTVNDVYFDDRNGNIIGYEISGGMFDKVAKGNSFLPIDDIINIGPDVVYIRSEAAYDLEEQKGGVQGAFGAAKDKASSAMSSVGQASGTAMPVLTRDQQIQAVEGKTASRNVIAEDGSFIVSEGATVTRSIAERAAEKGKLTDLVSATSDAMFIGASTRVSQQPEFAAVNERASKDVEADDGSIIVAHGQRITQEHIEEARVRNKLDDLMDAAGVERPQPTTIGGGISLPNVGDRVSGLGDQMGGKAGQIGDKASDLGDKAGDKAGQATDSALGLWDKFTRKLTQATDAAGGRVDEQQSKTLLSKIQDAVGRPVTKVILDKQDNVILNLGDLITHAAVQRAYDNNMLDTLLDNVYKGEVSFTRDEMRAKVQGEAVLEKTRGQTNAQVVHEIQQKLDQKEQERTEKREQDRMEAETKRQDREAERDQRQMERQVQANPPNRA